MFCLSSTVVPTCLSKVQKERLQEQLGEWQSMSQFRELSSSHLQAFCCSISGGKQGLPKEEHLELSAGEDFTFCCLFLPFVVCF